MTFKREVSEIQNYRQMKKVTLRISFYLHKDCFNEGISNGRIEEKYMYKIMTFYYF